MPSLTEPKLFAGNANRGLAKSVARRMSMHRGINVGLVDARVERFNDGEIFVEVFENVRGEDMFIIQPTSNPANDNLMELLIIADALRRSSASRITAVIPYFGYARQDRRTKARTPISAKLVANLIVQSGIERVLTMDLHAAQIQGFFDIPVDNLYASPIFALDIAHHFKGSRDNLMIVSPDVGGVARARELAQRIGAPLAIVDKRRERAGEVAEMTVIGEVAGKCCIIVDDIVDTAGTLCKAADTLIAAGATEVHSYITHGVLSGPAVERITGSVMKSLVVTDSIEASDTVRACKAIRIVPTAPMFAQAILNIWNGTSVSSLFDHETLMPIYEGFYSGLCTPDPYAKRRMRCADCSTGPRKSWPWTTTHGRATRARPRSGPASSHRCRCSPPRSGRGTGSGGPLSSPSASSASGSGSTRASSPPLPRSKAGRRAPYWASGCCCAIRISWPSITGARCRC